MVNKSLALPKQEISLTKEQITALTSVKNTADAMMSTAQEYNLCIEQVLMDHFNFTEKDLKKMHKEVEYILTVVREAEGAGLDATGLRTIRMLGEIAEIRKMKEVANSSGI